MYDSKFEPKENKIWTRDESELQLSSNDYLGGSITHESPTRRECGIRVPLQVINYLLDSSSCRKVY